MAIYAQGRRRAYTLVELLSVLLIIAIMMAISLPLYLSAVEDSKKKACRSNMQTIALAVKAARFKINASDYSSFIGAVDTTLETNLLTVPTCPSAGTYSIANASVGNNFKIVCTVSTHGSFEPGKDNN